MRLTKGTKVEVWSNKEVAIGAWNCAEIICGNGHTYSVKFGWFPKTTKPVVERIPRKAIRPCPPPVGGVSDLVEGNLVEAFHNLSWKIAIVVDVVDRESFLIRVVGLDEEFVVNKSRLRIRQRWEDGKWFVLEKGFGYPSANPIARHRCFPLEEKTEVHMVSPSRKLKRRSPDGSYTPQKKRMVGKLSGHEGAYLLHPYSPFDKVSTVDYAHGWLGESYTHTSFHVPAGTCSRIDVCEGVASPPIESSISIEADSYASSVGSCSPMASDAHDFPFAYSEHLSNMDDCSSDVESSSGREYEKKPFSYPSHKQLDLGGHRSELHAYLSVVGALYASGPLTWEGEAKLTNLRHQLHISSDEHLMVIKEAHGNG